MLMNHGIKRCLYLLTMSVLAACATYKPVALHTSNPLQQGVLVLKHDMHVKEAASLPKAWLAHGIDVQDGIDEIELAILVVLNNPQLRANQTQLLEAQARLIDAGLLLDPPMAMSLDIPQGAGFLVGGNLSLGFDLQNLLTRDIRQTRAREEAKAIYLKVLWQQWQTISQARLLWRRAWMEQKQLQVLQQQRQQAKSLWQLQDKALVQHNSTLDQHTLALTAWVNAKVAYLEGLRQHNATQHQLCLMLGINPLHPIRLATPKIEMQASMMLPMSDDTLRPLLQALGKTRPDLLALQAGYQSQEAVVRASILAQYPSFSIGMNRSRDTAGLWSFGPWLNLNLPLFNANRGQIAIAKASRTRLQQTYLAQHANAQVQIQQMSKDQQLRYQQWQLLKTALPQLAQTLERMSHALAKGQVDMLTFMSLRNTFFSQQAQKLKFEQSLLEQAVALDTLLGTWQHESKNEEPS